VGERSNTRQRFAVYYGKAHAKMLKDGQLPHFREKWFSLSEYVKEIKQGVFSGTVGQ